jgi:hypothetical protein
MVDYRVQNNQQIISVSVQYFLVVCNLKVIKPDLNNLKVLEGQLHLHYNKKRRITISTKRCCCLKLRYDFAVRAQWYFQL